MLINSGVFPTIRPTTNSVNNTYTSIYTIPIPAPPGIACINIATRNEVTALGVIPASDTFIAPVFVDMEIKSNNVLLKVPNLVSINVDAGCAI